MDSKNEMIMSNLQNSRIAHGVHELKNPLTRPSGTLSPTGGEGWGEGASRFMANGLSSITFLVLAMFSAHCHAASHPNIIYVLADDLGYGDVSCYNPKSKIATPNIDRLASEGMRFTDAHTPSAVCTPTRYGILTGRYSWRTRLKYRVLDGFDPPLIEPGRLTVPALLKLQGYHTACVGKWHLGMTWHDRQGNPLPAVPVDRKTPPRNGREVDYSRAIQGGPTARGFDHYFGISASLNMSPFCYIENDRPVVIPHLQQERIRTDFITVDEGVRSPDFTITGVMPRLTGEAVRYIESRARAKKHQPFFLYFPLTAPHLPVVPNEEFKGKSEAGLYGDFVAEVDDCVGAIMAALERTGATENTLLIFTSDNGGLYHWWKPQEADDLKNYRISSRAQYVKDRGHQGNAHLRGTKADIWEGGHRVPFIARWPGKTPAGTTCSALVELTDLMATAAAVTGTQLPDDAGEDSRNILPLLLGLQPAKPVREFAVHHSLWGMFAIRQGPWKLVEGRGSGGFTRQRLLDPNAVGGPPGQLYHLYSDPSETKNIWEQHPDVVERLTKLLRQVKERGE